MNETPQQPAPDERRPPQYPANPRFSKSRGWEGQDTPPPGRPDAGKQPAEDR
jgi:hypothetical protein